MSKNIHLSEFTSIPTFAIPSVCTVWMSSNMLSRKWKLNHRPYMTVCYVWRELYLLRAYCNVYNTIFLMFHHCNLIWNCRCVSFVGWLYSYIASIQERCLLFLVRILPILKSISIISWYIFIVYVANVLFVIYTFITILGLLIEGNSSPRVTELFSLYAIFHKDSQHSHKTIFPTVKSSVLQ